MTAGNRGRLREAAPELLEAALIAYGQLQQIEAGDRTRPDAAAMAGLRAAIRFAGAEPRTTAQPETLAREATQAELCGIAWWNRQTPESRAHWLRVSGSAVPADAWAAYSKQSTIQPTSERRV